MTMTEDQRYVAGLITTPLVLLANVKRGYSSPGGLIFYQVNFYQLNIFMLIVELKMFDYKIRPFRLTFFEDTQPKSFNLSVTTRKITEGSLEK